MFEIDSDNSLHEEWNEGVVDIILGELEVISLNADELNFLVIHERLETNVVVDVEITVFKFLNAASLGRLLEPF